MAVPTTVLDFLTQQNTRLTAELNAAQSDLTAKQTALATAAGVRSAAQQKLVDLTTDMAALRTKLAGTVTKEDGEALLVSLQKDIEASRKATAALADADLNLTIAKAEAAAAAALVARLTPALAASTTALADGKTQDKRRAALKAAVLQPPLKTISTDAGTEAGAPQTAARTRLEGDLTVKLLARALDREKQEKARAASRTSESDQARSLVESKQASDGGIADGVIGPADAFQRADDALTDYVANAVGWLAQATAILKKVTDPSVAPLTPDQKTAIHDAALVGPAETAADVEQVLDADRAKLAAAEAALNIANWTAKKADPDAPPADSTARDQASADLISQQGTYAPHEQAARDWEAAVPDATWQLVSDFVTATALLDKVQTPNGDTLSSNMDAAEKALAKALDDADKSARSLAFLEGVAAKQAAIATFETTAAEGRQFSAARGDF